MIQVTVQEWNVLTFIRAHYRKEGFSPSVVEVATGCSAISRYAMYRLLKKMERRGLLRLGGQAHKERSIVLHKVAVGVAL